MQLYLDFHDTSILVSGKEESVVLKLREEFHYFVKPETSKVSYTIDLFQEPPPSIPATLATKILETCSVYNIGSRRYIDYRGEALTIWDRMEDTVQIYSESSERLYELAFLCAHSLLGQELDRKGLCRIHAVAVSLKHVNALVMLPSKGGKSTLLTHLLENPEVKIISDDMPLIDFTGRVHPFPSKISMDKIPQVGPLAGLKWNEFKRSVYPIKYTAGLSQLSERIETSSPKHKTLLVAGYRLSQGSSILTPVPKWKMLSPLLEHMVMGFGLPQVLEMFLNFQFLDFFKLGWHALMRTIAAINLLRRSQCYHFYLGPDRAYNAQLLLDQMYEQQDA